MAKPPRPDSPAESEEEEVGTTLLALPDGPVDAADAPTHTTSFIGGYPTFPAGTSAPDAVKCGACHEPIPLLTQVYCPLEDGENDRTLYVWACARAPCRRREGSVRAFRASVRNDEYVEDVRRKREEAERIAREEREKARVNPFTMKESSNGGLFGAAQPLFGAAASNPFAPAPASTPGPAPEPATTTTAAPTAQVAALSLSSPSPVTLAPPLPAYQPAQYLTTIDEYLPLPESDDESVESDDDETPEQKADWRGDGWERLLPRGVDDIFERFVRRLESAEDGAAQVLRYDFGAVPLPYSSSSPLFKKLFPGAPTRAPSSEEEEVDLAAYYSTKGVVPPCTRCGGKRVFELQLVPQLINVLRPAALSTTGHPNAPTAPKSLTEEQRRDELKRIAKGEADDVADMEWGTVMVFACERDCTGTGEEWVGVEWEALVDAA